MSVVVIGLGGIGSHLVWPLSRYLHHSMIETSLSLIDGDSFEMKNKSRQEFGSLGNKAEVIAQEVGSTYPNLEVSGKGWYVTEENVFVAVREGDIIFSGVDNHSTRKLLSDRLEELENGVLISGGNAFSDGNVQILIRANGTSMTPPLGCLHPEIEQPADKNPAEMSCEELAASGTPQLIFVNYLASAWMLTTYWKYLEWRKAPIGPFPYSEIYFDAITGNSRSVHRSQT